MSVIIECKKCGLIGMFTYDKDHKTVSKMVIGHKSVIGNKGHRVKVDRT